MNTIQILYLTMNLASSTWFMQPAAVRDLQESDAARREHSMVLGRELLRDFNLHRASNLGHTRIPYLDTPQPGLVTIVEYWPATSEIEVSVRPMVKDEGGE